MIEEHLRNLVISGFGVKLTKSGDLIEVVDKDKGLKASRLLRACEGPVQPLQGIHENKG